MIADVGHAQLAQLPFIGAEPMIGAEMSRNHRIASRALVVLALASSLVARSSRADDSGWFDESAQPATPSPPAAGTAPAPARPVPPPLEPSPLLEDKTPDVQDDADDRDPRALTEFRGELDPYGAWEDDPSYGRVWVPHAHVVGTSFQPYVSGGHWALDEHEEWVWVSDYPFGHVVFHYGRWVWTTPRGWVWIPGYRYAPAWVVWRVPSGGSPYVGWAPAPPTFVWFGGVSMFWGYDPYYTWVFCPSAYVFSYHVHYHVVRDRYWMSYAARHTVPYRAPDRARSGPSRSRPVSPPIQTAKVPRNRVPRERVISGSAAPAGRAGYAPSGVGSGARRSLSPGKGAAPARETRVIPREGGSVPRQTRPIPRPGSESTSRSTARPEKAVPPRTEKAAPPRPRPERARPESAPRPSSPGKVRRPSFGPDRPSFKDRPRAGSSGVKAPRKR
jgi:hypothetical protein